MHRLTHLETIDQLDMGLMIARGSSARTCRGVLLALVDELQVIEAPNLGKLTEKERRSSF